MDRFLITTQGPAMTSEILIARGFPEPLLPDRGDRQTTAILTQPGAKPVADRVLRAVGARSMMELPDRDQAKAISVLEQAYLWLAESGLRRGDTIIGVGGGAVTDVAGFVAATWLRGIESVMVPTTLLGAVDAAIGGKTGINLAGKNLIGAFHLPSRVVIDLDVLGLIPDDLRREGSAEILKAGLIADPSLVELYERHGIAAPLDQAVPKAVAVKTAVVSGDFREDGRRAVLNFGHTIGHAVEIVSGMPHGFAVAVGMVAAGAVSAARYGFPQQWLTDLIFSLGLPVAAAGLSADALLELVDRDKKRTAEGIRMVLLRSVGDPVVDIVGADELELGLKAIGVRSG